MCGEYHYLVLYADRLVAVNQVSGKVVSEVNWGPGVHASGILGGSNLHKFGMSLVKLSLQQAAFSCLRSDLLPVILPASCIADWYLVPQASVASNGGRCCIEWQ